MDNIGNIAPVISNVMNHMPSNESGGQLTKKQLEIRNNEKTIKAAVKSADHIPEPELQAAIKTYKAVDAATGGLATKVAARAMRSKPLQHMTKYGANLKQAQRMSNFLNKNKVKPLINSLPLSTKKISSKDGMGKTKNEFGKSGNFKLKLPANIKLIALVVGIILAIIMFIVVVFIVIFTNEENGSVSEGGSSYAYGETCTTVTVTNSGCDGNAENCTNAYDGEVDLEDYVAGVVAAEVGEANNLEYYKVSAIAARTYLLSNVSSSCTIAGNATSQEYTSVDNSSNSELIKQAVEETKGQVLIKNDEIISANYSSACVVNADSEYYYVRYGTISLGSANYQKIIKTWDSEESAYKGYLNDWYSQVDTTNTNNDERTCPGNHDYGMSQLGALYLITEEDYTYDQVLEYYFGSDAELVKNTMQLAGIEGFVNPTRTIHCSSAYGNRIHPVNQIESFHSGLDIGIPGGEPIYAAKDGTISYVRNDVTAINNCDYGYGNYIVIDHGNGQSTIYAHIKYGSIPENIELGTTISQGEIIGQVGSTGCSTGNHLHYEVKENGSTVDPALYLDLTDATGECQR